MIRPPTTTETIGLALVVTGVLLGASSCRTPTQTTIEIVSEVAHRSDMAVSVQLGGVDDVESATPRVVARGAWAADGTVGTVVAVPSGGEGDEFAVRVVLAVGRDPATCTALDAGGCVVVRRTARFVEHESSRLRIVLRPACLGTFCDARTSCARDGACGALDSDRDAGDGGVDAAPAVGSDPYAATVLVDRPRHFYRFDEPAGAHIAKDAMGRADGTYEGGVTLGVTGALATSDNAGAYFDGVDGSVVVPRLTDLPGASTFEAWVRSDTSAVVEPTILERLDRVGSEAFGYRLSRPPETVAAFVVFRGVDTTSAFARPKLFAGYSHVVAVTSGGAIDLYVDGISSAHAIFADGPPPAVLAPFVIGKSRTGGGAWRGTIDEVAVYDYPLSVEQMARHRLAAGEKATP